MSECAYCHGWIPCVPNHPGSCVCGAPFRASWFAVDRQGHPYARRYRRHDRTVLGRAATPADTDAARRVRTRGVLRAALAVSS